MNIISANNRQTSLLARVLRPLLLALSVLSIMPVQALDIKGDVYGGGKSGNVGVEGTPSGTEVDIYESDIRTVFGGGQDGKVYGTTNVNINGGIIGDDKWNDTPYGGVYGAGEGAEATVFGTANVNMVAGSVVNNIYGGGKMAALQGNTNVHLTGGTISGSVYGGARMADIQGRTYVWVDGGANTLEIGSVYGGNDISGNITSNLEVVTKPYDVPVSNINDNDNWKNWNAFVRVTSTAADKVKIGSLYGGGNGAYQYGGTEGNYTITMKDYNSQGEETTITYSNLNHPTLGKVLVDLQGGSFDAVYGGGNNATVTGSTDIYFNGDYLNAKRVFGGNNLAEMAIRPTWHLRKGVIGDLYSGGNRGDMTSSNGLILAIESAYMTIENVYGGCRMADVNPITQPGAETYTTTVGGKQIAFEGGYAARLYISGGKIKNVYGGNDVSGTVNHGANVEIFSSISGSIYGAGNGAYLYTDHPDSIASDFYYNPGSSSVDALYAYRPQVEKTLLHIAGPVNDDGTPTENPLYVAGNVFCGGNSAPLSATEQGATTQFRIGKNVVIDGVFLGSNGEQMVQDDVLDWYADQNNSTISLTDAGQMEKYMAGVAVDLVPHFSVDWTEELTPDVTKTYIGSLYLGGNVGSLTTKGQIDVEIPNSITIYEKIVGGSNNAFVQAHQDRNAKYEGGVIGESSDDYKLKLTVASRMEPKKLKADLDSEGYVTSASLEWNTEQPLGLSEDVLAGANIYGGCYESGIVNGNVVIDITDNLISPNIITNELYTYNDGANRIGEYVFTNAISVFGGGYGEQSTINGNTTINLTDNARVFKVFGGGELGGVTRNTSINLANNLEQPTEEHHYNAFKVYGGGLQGNVGGTASVNVQGGKFYDIFGGSCFADIDGTAKVVIGSAQSAGSNNPINIVNNVYGANDFGGTVKRSVSFGQYGYGNKYVKAQTMVQYYSGIVHGNIFGGANGAYNYTNFQIEMTGKYPVLNTAVTETATNFITANTFVHIASPSTKTDKIIGAVYGGGQGFSGSTGIVDVKDTYVHLDATGSYQDRVTNGAGPLVSKVFGGAYYSYVENTTVDAADGYYDEIYGGTFGDTHKTLPANISYDCGKTNVNVYGMNNLGLNVYGAGAKSGATTTNVNLCAGNIGYAYGGSFAEGYCGTTNVTIPETSTIRVKAIYGGSVGFETGLPCDVGQSNVKFASSGAFITGEGLFGGNKSYRATKNTNVLITAPVHQSADVYADVYASGHGENTVTGYALVTLDNRALVRNVYGGALDGTVRYAYDDKSGADAYYATNSTKYAHWVYADPETALENRNTRIIIEKGATVKENVFGGGFGQTATVHGATSVSLLGGIVEGDIYGGGSRGNMEMLSSSDTDKKVLSILEIYGGKVRRVFGGGLEGYIEGESDVTIGLRKQVVNGALSEKVYNKNNVLVEADIDWGKPAVLRSAYGGGERGKVTNTNITMNNGYVGYDYDYNTGKYLPNVKLHSQDDLNLLANNGNLYGGGFGDKAWAVNTNVEMYGGTIRHSLYGGGEIASVGFATMKIDEGVIKEVDWTKPVTEGSTKVTMYGGTVERDVFGGGRGFSYTLAGALEVENIYYSSGFVFGKTEVNIHRGIVGTDETLKEEAGNVFGGGNIGYVYSVKGKKNGVDGNRFETGHYYDTEGKLTEDCKVLITPVTVALDNFEIGSHIYTPGDFVPCEDLNTLLANDGRWAKMDEQGITIRNAVFAGGNVIQGTDIMTADAKTVFGNVTASVLDVFDCDMVSVSTENIGGFYGDGNLSLVDGYRELNITNYGTDYHNLTHEITYDDYAKMHPRKKAYYELKYICLNNHEYVDANSKTHWYVEGDQISGSVWGSMPKTEQDNWKLAGLATLYAGRMINTIQRADFCGVWGSRVVLKGARDRETTTADFTLYTINRLDELSLNEITKDKYPISGYNSDGTKDHGCYFGIYNVVNRLGAVSSNVDYYTAVRVTDNGEDAYKPTEEAKTYYAFKNKNAGTKFRNNGKSANIIALAGGVWLEIVKDIDEQTGEKDYGPITGVIQLDLINVAVGEGGGYVYADNIHGTRTPSGADNVTLAESNNNAVSYKRFAYSDDQAELYASSGNFVHSFKQIVDDCYPNNGDKNSPAHYWYVRGDFYVYNQTISAYTGTPQSYSETVSIPLSITAGANGKLQLLSVDDSYYAYYEGLNYGGRILTADDSVRIAGQYYHTNDPISSWDYNRLAESEKAFFTETTYVCIDDVLNIDGETKDTNGNDLGDLAYKKGKVILPSAYETLKSSTVKVKIHDPEGTTADDFKEVPVSYFFHPTNNMGKDEGFLLTYKMNNPAQWDDYYSIKTGTPNQISLVTYNDPNTNKESYVPGPSFLNVTGGIYGQYTYNAGDIINHSVYKEQQDLLTAASSNNVTVTDQAEFEIAYVAKENVHVKTFENGQEIDMFVTVGNVISYTDYNRALNENVRKYFELAVLCTQTFEKAKEEWCYNGDIIPLTEYTELIGTNSEFKNYFSIDGSDNDKPKTWLCTKTGNFGGHLFITQNSYDALQYAGVQPYERVNFTFNKDAFDLLSTNFNVNLNNYDPSADVDPNTENDGNRYSGPTRVDYTAKYVGGNNLTVTDLGIIDINETPLSTISQGVVLNNVNFEKLPNEKRKFAMVNVTDEHLRVDNSVTPAKKKNTFYVVKNTFKVGDSYYTRGRVLIDTVYTKLKVDENTATSSVMQYSFAEAGVYYVCVDGFENRNTLNVLNPVNREYKLTGVTTTEKSANSGIDVGDVITAASYNEHVVNMQTGFQVQGTMPTETSTLYVPRSADVRDLSEDKIVTVVYEYTYLESDQAGVNFEEITERHIVNIRVHFESGVPKIGELQTPQTVLPGDVLGMNTPTVTPGAYEIMSGGFEIFSNELDAFAHKNGVAYQQGRAPLYWYQNEYWIAYYAKTYLGKTYSSPVRLSVANYHRLKDVLDHPEYMFVDSITDTYSNKPAMLRNPKIYINDDVYTENRNGTEVQLNEFDYLIELYNNHLIDGVGKHNGQIKYANNLEFILQSDVEPLYYKDKEWKLGDSSSGENCFQGNLHGDGYTIGGLTHSLFNKLCGNVYNLGVTGSFTGAGISDNGGAVYNSWVSTSATPTTAPVIASGGSVVNSYYNNTQYTGSYSNGATAASTREFADGTVAYKLNGYYQQKRSDITSNKKRTGSDGAYLKNNGTSTFPTIHEITGSESSSSLYGNVDYVEERMKTGDFRYEKGEVPYRVGEIRYVDGNPDEGTAAKFVPIYPDDYIFFGQNLTYGLVQGKDHNDNPMRIEKRTYSYSNTVDDVTIDYEPELIDAVTDADNRVFRAPAYTVQSPTVVATEVHYNRDAVFTDSYKEMVIDRDVTAIDFTGKDTDGSTFANSWLDFDGVKSIYLKGLTRNMLIYADASQEDSYSVLMRAANEPELFVNPEKSYNTVAVVQEAEYPLFHLVGKQLNEEYRAATSQFLVDKQNFAAPKSYSFNDGYYMWYQRRPAYYANSSTDGWEGLILPFTADLVTTQDKGEITHFYGNSDKGHEYWLRGFAGVTDGKAQFVRPMSNVGDAGYDSRYKSGYNAVSNSFLYDTYYNKNYRDDANADDYFEYYNTTRNYSDYIWTTMNVPYIVAYPGVAYYEFDMSGNFVAENTATPAPAKLDAQVVTYVSKEEQNIDIYKPSDLTSNVNGYILYGSYLNTPAAETGSFYKIDANGSGFAVSSDNTEAAVPFRVYLKASSQGAPTRGDVLEYIPIGGDADYIAEQAPLRGLNIYGKNHVIYIESSLDFETVVTVYSTSGQIIARVDVAPGATVKVPVNATGVYIVNRKKVMI